MIHSTDDLLAELDNLPDTGHARTYLDDIMAVLRLHGATGLLRLDVIRDIERGRRERNCAIPRHFEETVQNTFNKHNDQSTGEARLGQPRLFTTHKDGQDTYWAMRIYRRK
jgi:hypothetical protein